MSESEVLVIASKLKKYIKAKAGMNTSAEVFDALTEEVRKIVDRAIENAKNDKRKTVKARDIA